MQGIIKLAPRVAALVVAASGLAGCASFSPDGGLGVVADITGRTTGKEVASVRTDDDAARLRDATRRLLSRPLSADAAVQVALFNNKGL
ncbi:MAG: TolC family protein, partial [Bradyrhizobium sp.]